VARLAMIVAAAENDVIGRGNALPWDLPGDLRYFRRVTLGKPVIMGRRTFDAIGRPLPGRCNIVVSRDPDFAAAGVRVARSLDEALALAEAVAEIDGADEIMLIGGAQLYALGLPRVQRIYLTRVHGAVDGDTRLPALDWSQFRELSRERHARGDGDSHDYSCIVYERLGAGDDRAG
jgi:dihydrofolate reductase